ncbi:hypothetical protein NOCARDAX2BIS_490070 [Nocardioides sp. AX2bis]|nr:hypothetical protein NOCARDAX2BIS_490070 [Nocardioides sp. AX2bis]
MHHGGTDVASVPNSIRYDDGMNPDAGPVADLAEEVGNALLKFAEQVRTGPGPLPRRCLPQRCRKGSVPPRPLSLRRSVAPARRASPPGPPQRHLGLLAATRRGSWPRSLVAASPPLSQRVPGSGARSTLMRTGRDATPRTQGRAARPVGPRPGRQQEQVKTYVRSAYRKAGHRPEHRP